MDYTDWLKASPDGVAYGRPAQHADRALTETGPGTPMGELLRRYWHPIALSSELQGLPRRVRVLGEDPVAFRDLEGRSGLLYPRCMHRGTTLYYGRVEQRGIRCCYHGWLFDVQGRCLEQPCEPDGGRHRDRARQPWYPVQERYGFVFAYLGPPERQPALPRYDNLEDLGDDERIWCTLGGFGATGDHSLEVVPYSWMHMNDNIMDPFHVHVLHTTFTEAQFSPDFGVMPEVDFYPSERGLCYAAVRKLPDGREVNRVSSWFHPNVMSVPDIDLAAGQASMVSWLVPVDDTHYRQAMAMKIPADGEVRPIRFGGRLWGEMSDADHQRYPGDYEAQAGQGSVSLHSEEHLVSSDRGIVMLRRMLRQQMKAVAAGEDPLNCDREEADALVRVPSGNFYS